MDHIKLHFNDFDALELLGDAERGRLFTALLVYGMSGEAPRLGGNERFLFAMMRARIDEEKAAEIELSEARRKAGRKGAQAKLAKLANAEFAEQIKQMPDLLSSADFAKTDPSPSSPPSPSPPSSPPITPVITPVSLSPVLTPPPKEKPPKGGKKKAPMPPSLEDVTAYCLERQNGIDPEAFVNFYTANGWKQGKGKPIVDWKAAVRTWEKNQESASGTSAQSDHSWMKKYIQQRGSE